VPYTRYFLADILQFQFHRALCKEAGFQGKLHECSIYGSEKAGAKFAKMLEMGASQPWPDELAALSVTPAYLVKVGLLDKAPAGGGDVPLLLRKALEKVAFLPFGLMVDQWRWKVFSGEIKPANYNQAWWELVRKYQGVAPPVARSEADFDPGAKYHVAANVPYTRYFLADILQFQFHRALCRQAGYQGPLHLCSVYDDKAVGKKLADMLAMGQSRPWPDALFALTGERQMDATAMLEYFAPLKTWLDEQNKGRRVGF